MICIVGSGKMGKALAAGFIGSGMDPRELTMVERHAERHGALRTQFEGANVSPGPIACDAAIVATKPADVAVAASAAAGAGARRIISVAAGVSLATIEAAAPGVPVVRTMPNVGVLVSASTTGVCSNDPAACEWAAQLMRRVGIVVVTDEAKFHALTALAGSAPAFVARFAEALIDSGTQSGLSEGDATALVSGMLWSTAQLMTNQPMQPAELRKMVSTPGGTTLAGLQALEEGGIESAVQATVAATIQRSIELGKQ